MLWPSQMSKKRKPNDKPMMDYDDGMMVDIDKIKTNRMKRGLSILCNRIHGNGLSHRPQAKRWRKFGERFKLLKSKLSQFISFTFMSRSIVVKSFQKI
jgi:hypothetical protein